MEEKCYRFDFLGTQRGYGFVTAKNEEEARNKIMDGDYDDILDTLDEEITEIIDLEEYEDEEEE